MARRRPLARLAVLLTAGGCIAACGGSTAPPRSDPPPPAAEPAIAPCVPGARRAVARAGGTGSVTARTTAVAPGEATCVYRGPGLRVDVHVDANPQAAVRFDRAVVERDQVAIWSGEHSRAPRLLHGVGQGADWFPADRELLATDGRRLLSVRLVRSTLDGRAALRVSRSVASATLGQVR